MDDSEERGASDGAYFSCQEPSLIGQAISTPVGAQRPISPMRSLLGESRYRYLLLSPIVETSKEQDSKKSTDASNSQQKSTVTGHQVNAPLPRLQPNNVIKLDKDVYTIDCCFGCENLFRMLPCDPLNAPLVGYARMGNKMEEVESTVSMKVVHLLRDNSSLTAHGILLPRELYSFSNGSLWTYSNFAYRTLGELCELLRKQQPDLEEETYAAFAFELLNILAFLESNNITHGGIDERSLIVFGATESRDQLSPAANDGIVKLADFRSCTVRSEPTTDRVGIARAIRALLLADQSKSFVDLAPRSVGRIPHHWNRKCWQAFFDRFDTTPNGRPFDSYMEEFKHIFQRGIRSATSELNRLSGWLQENIQIHSN